MGARWYSEQRHYKFDKPGPTPTAANFAQVVWGRTASVGMALSDDGKFCVANYFPPGNTEFPDPAKSFERYVQPIREGPPPWEPGDHQLAPEGEPICTEDNWRKHDDTTA